MRRSPYTGKMKIAILSDIHGNMVALEAALEDVKNEEVQRVVCLGDVAVLGPQPAAVLSRLRAASIPTVMGNADAWLLDPQPEAAENEDDRRMAEVDQWCAAQLTGDDRDLIRRFAPTLTLEAGDVAIRCYHGSPRSFDDGIRPDTTDEQLAEWLGGGAVVYAGGHTHTVMLRPFGAALVINPGSVGLPYKNLPGGEVINPTWAEYAIVTVDGDRLSVDFRRAPYPLERLRQSVLASGMPHGEWYLRDWRE